MNMPDQSEVLKEQIAKLFRQTFGVGGELTEPALKGAHVDVVATEGEVADDPPAAAAEQSGVPPQRGRGAPLGNQTALRHGLYARVLTPEQREALELGFAEDSRFLEKEIPLLRMKIEALVADPNTDPDVLLRALGILSRMIRINVRIKYGL
jgi:hypothetical protein